MELRPGYKQTEVGFIPVNWDVKLFTEVTNLITCGIAATPVYVAESRGFPFLSSTNVKDGRIVWSDYKHISDDLHRKLYRNNPPERGDILYSRVGTFGEAAVVDVDFEFSIYVSLTLIKPKPQIDSQFLKHLLNSDAYKKRAREQIYLGGGVGNLNVDVVRRYPIAIPPLGEQRSIASALSDVDALIDGLTRLIAKKRDLKQATMQQLLTGQTRLPGFDGTWEEKCLGELGEITGAGVDKKIRSNEIPVRLLNYMDVYKRDFLRANDFWHEVTAKPDQARRCAVQRGDIFFTPTSEIREDIGHSAVAIEDAPDVVYSYHVVRLRLSKEWDVNFRAYVFKTKHFLDQASTQSEGSGTRYVITLPKFRSMTVRYPTDVAEQAAIGNILSDMDAELAALEARLTKTRALKQAMMSELLTGKTRLPT